MPADEFESPDDPRAASEQDKLRCEDEAVEGPATPTPSEGTSEDDDIRVIVEELEAEAEGEKLLSEGEAGPGDSAVLQLEPELEAQPPVNGEAPSEDGVVASEQPAAPMAEISPSSPEASRRPSIWPFIVYDLVWLAFAAVVVWQLLALPPGAAVYSSAVYEQLLYLGVALTAAGPLLILGTWALDRSRKGVETEGPFVYRLIAGAFATLLGVALWWGALLVVDYVRLGQLF